MQFFVEGVIYACKFHQLTTGGKHGQAQTFNHSDGAARAGYVNLLAGNRGTGMAGDVMNRWHDPYVSPRFASMMPTVESIERQATAADVKRDYPVDDLVETTDRMLESCDKISDAIHELSHTFGDNQTKVRANQGDSITIQKRMVELLEKQTKE